MRLWGWLLALAVSAGVGFPTAARAQPCTITTPDGSRCDDDLDPCTDDRCDDGVCEHPAVGFVEACAPVLAPFQRVLVLTPFADRLAARVGALPVGDPPAFTPGQRAAIVQDLSDLGDSLGRVQDTLGGTVAEAGDTAQSRAKVAAPDADESIRVATLVRDLVRAAAGVDQFTESTAAELERSTADMLRGAKAIKRDLVRLRKVSQVFR